MKLSYVVSAAAAIAVADAKPVANYNQPDTQPKGYGSSDDKPSYGVGYGWKGTASEDCSDGAESSTQVSPVRPTSSDVEEVITVKSSRIITIIASRPTSSMASIPVSSPSFDLGPSGSAPSASASGYNPVAYGCFSAYGAGVWCNGTFGGPSTGSSGPSAPISSAPSSTLVSPITVSQPSSAPAASQYGPWGSKGFHKGWRHGRYNATESPCETDGSATLVNPIFSSAPAPPAPTAPIYYGEGSTAVTVKSTRTRTRKSRSKRPHQSWHKETSTTADAVIPSASASASASVPAYSPWNCTESDGPTGSAPSVPSSSPVSPVIPSSSKNWYHPSSAAPAPSSTKVSPIFSSKPVSSAIPSTSEYWSKYWTSIPGPSFGDDIPSSTPASSSEPCPSSVSTIPSSSPVSPEFSSRPVSNSPSTSYPSLYPQPSSSKEPSLTIASPVIPSSASSSRAPSYSYPAYSKPGSHGAPSSTLGNPVIPSSSKIEPVPSSTPVTPTTTTQWY